MPSKRTPRGHRPKARVTPEAVALFVRTEVLFPIYLACVHDACRSRTDGVHCPECREYLDASLARDSLLGIEPWMRSLEEVDTAEPPPNLDNDPLRAKAWRRTWQLRCALEAEVAKRRAAP